MEPVFDLASVDIDGAIQETEAAVAGDTRASFFRKAAIGGGTVLTSGAIMGMLPEMAMGRPSKKQDVSILNFALTLEYLETAFYKEARAKSDRYSQPARDIAALIYAHEQTHVNVLRKVIKSLGAKPVAMPQFDFKGTTDEEKSFIGTAFVLENTGVQAYLGQAGRLQSKALLSAAATIATVEARHAAAVAVLNGDDPYNPGKGSITPQGSFDTPKSKKFILKAVGRTGFIKG